LKNRRFGIAASNSIMYNKYRKYIFYNFFYSMISTTLSMHSTGAITLPKKWRERYPTKNFIVNELADGSLNIKPILDVEYYENADGSCGLKFPNGIDMHEFVKVWDKAMHSKKKNG